MWDAPRVDVMGRHGQRTFNTVFDVLRRKVIVYLTKSNIPAPVQTQTAWLWREREACFTCSRKRKHRLKADRALSSPASWGSVKSYLMIVDDHLTVTTAGSRWLNRVYCWRWVTLGIPAPLAWPLLLHTQSWLSNPAPPLRTVQSMQRPGTGRPARSSFQTPAFQHK